MDKQASKREERVNQSQSGLSETDILKYIDESNQNTIKIIDDKLKSRWLWGNARTLLKIYKELLGITNSLAKANIQTLFMIDRFQKRAENLEKVVQEIAEKAKVDLSKVKSEIAKLRIESPMSETIRKYINDFRKEWEEWKTTKDKYLPKKG